MTPIKRGPSGTFSLYVPKQKGGVILRTTGTTDKRTYNLMKAMIARLKNERRWPLLTAIVARTLTIARVFDADRTKSLDALEASLSAEALAPHVTAYLASCKGRGLAPRNVENIQRQLASFQTVATTTADLTAATVTAWLAGLTTTPGTRRQYLYAVTGLTRYLYDTNALKDYPLARVKAPKKNLARMTYHDIATDEKIVQAARSDVRALFAFVKATGCDLSTALTVTKDDMAPDWTVRLRGTKTAQRDVHHALIEVWAWGYIEDAMRSCIGAAPLFHGVTRSIAAHQHELACKAVGVTGYTLKDSRHSVAVRMMQRGYTVAEIAEQLGNSPELVARVYSAHQPKMAHRVTPHVTSANEATR